MGQHGVSVDRRRWIPAALFALVIAPFARAENDVLERPATAVAPLEIPHTLDVVLTELARKRNRRPGNIESFDFLDLTPGLTPLVWPRYSDVRARLLTPELKNTPLVGWIAQNLYRSRNDEGWCLELDPGDGEYLIFYRFHPR